MTRYIVGLRIFRCGNGSDEQHSVVFKGSLAQPVQCQSETRGRKHMARMGFQDISQLKDAYVPSTESF